MLIYLSAIGGTFNCRLGLPAIRSAYSKLYKVMALVRVSYSLERIRFSSASNLGMVPV